MNLVERAEQMLCNHTGEKIPVIYMPRLTSGKLYVGSTTDLWQRMADHDSGRACKTTRDDKPVALLYIEPQPAFSHARQREAQIKRWSRVKKEALAANDLQTLQRLAKSHD